MEAQNKKEKERGKKIQFSFICIPQKGGKGSNSWKVVIGKRIHAEISSLQLSKKIITGKKKFEKMNSR